MNIVEITAASLRFADALPEAAPEDGFVWIYLDRAELPALAAQVQQAAQRLGGSALLDVHLADLASELHPSNYDATSVYDLIIFRRLGNPSEIQRDDQPGDLALPANARDAFARIHSYPVGFALFDKLLISVHPAGCNAAQTLIARLLADAKLSVEAVVGASRNRVPQNPVDLTLRMINAMVDSYLELRKDLSAALEQVQRQLLMPRPKRSAWQSVIHARRRLQLLEDLCEEQQDAMQEWLDTLRELPLSTYAADAALAQGRRDQLMARARDTIEHIERVLRHARRLEQSAEAAVQIHFGAQGQRTNDIMRILTAITAVFLPLNLFTGFFGMNFEQLPLIHSAEGMWAALALLTLLALGILALFWRWGFISEPKHDP